MLLTVAVVLLVVRVIGVTGVCAAGDLVHLLLLVGLLLLPAFVNPPDAVRTPVGGTNK